MKIFDKQNYYNLVVALAELHGLCTWGCNGVGKSMANRRSNRHQRTQAASSNNPWTLPCSKSRALSDDMFFTGVEFEAK